MEIAPALGMLAANPSCLNLGYTPMSAGVGKDSFSPKKADYPYLPWEMKSIRVAVHEIEYQDASMPCHVPDVIKAVLYFFQLPDTLQEIDGPDHHHIGWEFRFPLEMQDRVSTMFDAYMDAVRTATAAIESAQKDDERKYPRPMPTLTHAPTPVGDDIPF